MDTEQIILKNRKAIRSPPSRCKSCGKSIYWLITADEKKAPVDLRPAVGFSSDGSLRHVYLSHFASCPDRLAKKPTKAK